MSNIECNLLLQAAFSPQLWRPILAARCIKPILQPQYERETPMNTATNQKPSQLKPWLKHFPKESLTTKRPNRTIYRTARETSEAKPNNKAIYYYGTSVKYAEFIKNVDNVAAAFYGMGVRPGDVVSILMPTSPESIYFLYAISKIGAVPNFIDPRMDVNRIVNAADGVDSRLLMTIDLAWPKVIKILDRLNVDHIVPVSAETSLNPIAKAYRALTTKKPKIPYGGKILKWKEFLAKGKGVEVPEAPYEEGSVAAITYTGGTTGTPKGVLITNDGLNSVSDGFDLSGVERYSDNDRFLEIIPIFSSYGVGVGVHMPIALGLELIVIPQYTPEQIPGFVRKYRPNHMIGVPAFYEQIMHSKEMWDFDLSFLLSTACGGDTMNSGLEERFNKFLKEHGAKYCLSQGYGLSEMTGAASFCFSDIYKDDSAGIPLLSTVIGIFDPETGEELDFNQQGEICLTGPSMMKGYHNNPEETDNIIRTHADGTKWIHSGDIGYLDEDGFLFIKGRIKQIIIKFDGHKVFPVSIESVINRHKAVGTCAVVGIPDPNHAQGDVPIGIVELKSTLEGEIDKEAIRKEILDLCDEELEERGKCADVVFIDKMLHTALEKHDYRKLTEVYKDHVIRPH